VDNSKNFGVATIIASDGEEDILNCKPQWEISQLNLPRFNSEEDEVEENSLQTGAETKKDGGERSQKAGLPVNDMVTDYRYRQKKSPAQKVKFTCNLVLKNSRQMLIHAAFLYSFSGYEHTTIKRNKYFSSDGCYIRGGTQKNEIFS